MYYSPLKTIIIIILLLFSEGAFIHSYKALGCALSSLYLSGKLSDFDRYIGANLEFSVLPKDA